MNKKGSTGLIILITFLATLGLALIGLTAYFKLSDKVIVDRADYEQAANIYREYEKQIDIQRLIDESFLWEYDSDHEKEAVYRAMLGVLGDQYSRYLNEEELTELLNTMNSSFTGVGIVFMDTEEGFLVTEVIKDGPAYSVGVEAGDLILKVDGKEFDSTEEMAVAIRGEAGTRVKILVKRGKEEKEFDIVRGKIDGSSVDSLPIEEDNLGYIRIKSFGNDTASAFDSAISGFESQGVKGIVIDLRNNPGGIFEAGVDVADRILPEGTITYTEDKKGNKSFYNSDSKHTNLPIVVLINESTGSTSEMLAAALKDNGYTLVGVTTYGKGIMQETRMYPDGTAVSVTTNQFFSPLGNPIHGVGVEPNEVLPLAAELTDTQLARAIDILR